MFKSIPCIIQIFQPLGSSIKCALPILLMIGTNSWMDICYCKLKNAADVGCFAYISLISIHGAAYWPDRYNTVRIKHCYSS